eukprot:Selendium_serpulae@DN4319_c0_g1_i14.p1
MVEHIFHAGRYKIYVPSLSIAISFSLAGVDVPQTPAGPGQSAPRQMKKQTPEETAVAEEGLAWARHNLLQRDIKFKVETCDRGGNFIGFLWRAKENVGAYLLKEGFGRRRMGPINDVTLRSEIDDAAKTGKDAAVRIWALPDPETFEKGAEGKLVATTVPTTVEITHVNDVTDLFVIDATDASKSATIQSSLQAAINDKVEGFMKGVKPPKENEIVAAQFSVDNEWYRAQVAKVSGDSADVFYIDYGNTETLPLSALRKLPEALSTSKIAPQAINCALSGLLPTNADQKGEVASFLTREVSVGPMSCTVDNRSGKTNLILLRIAADTGSSSSGTQTPSPTFNEMIVAKGLARVVRNPRKAQLPKSSQHEALVAAESTARKQHVHIWKYGDIDSGEE